MAQMNYSHFLMGLWYSVQFIWRTCCVFSSFFFFFSLKDECWKYLLFQIPTGTKYQNETGGRRKRSAPASRLSVTLHINTSVVIRKIAKEAVSPSLSSFEGHFAAQRQMPNTHPPSVAPGPLCVFFFFFLPHARAGSAADRGREEREIRESERKAFVSKQTSHWVLSLQIKIPSKP